VGLDDFSSVLLTPILAWPWSWDRGRVSRVLLMCVCAVALVLQSQEARPQSNFSSTPTSTGQTASSNSTAHNGNNAGEITSREVTTTFKVNVNLVQVRVVVRDGGGKAVRNLQKEDFELFDKGKPQVITQFAGEEAGARRPSKNISQSVSEGLEPAANNAPADVAENYVAYLFDDVHLSFGDLAQVRNAAERHLAAMGLADRAGIFTTSGQTQLDFTDDRAKLHDALLRLQPRPITRVGISSCFNISYYMADMIENKRDQDALAAATDDALLCEFHGDTRLLVAAQQMAESTASQVLASGVAESHVTLTVVNDVIRRMSVIPGQRSIVIISPGFLTPEMESEYMDSIDRALRARVVINALDARGLYTIDPGGDIAAPAAPSPVYQIKKQQYMTLEASANADILASFADGTGGTFFQNSNDLDEGLRRTVSTPEYSYVLAFSPQNLKRDGSFHAIKVKLKNPGRLTVQARRGYFAPKSSANPAQEAKREIEEALFSQEDVHNLPVELHTQFFKSSDAEAKLTVLAHIDVKRLSLKKLEGRNNNELTVVSALFNRNGDLLQGIEKTVTMRIKDETLERRLGSGITLRTSFDVKPGNYLVRLVVRDAEAQMVSAESDAVRIP
jgi:VWFA-related protein